jgi:hypothetical protein
VTLRHQASVLANTIREDLSIDITNAELSQPFGHSGGWAQGMMARYEQEVLGGHPLSRGRPRLVESEQEQARIQFCLRPHAERKRATVEDVIDYMRGAGKEVDRFCVKRFVERDPEKPALRQAVFLEEDHYNVNPDDIKAYFDCCRTQLAAIAIPFVSNADETRMGAPKKRQPASAIVSAQTGLRHTTLPETKSKTFEKKRLADFEMHEGYDYIVYGKTWCVKPLNKIDLLTCGVPRTFL